MRLIESLEGEGDADRAGGEQVPGRPYGRGQVGVTGDEYDGVGRITVEQLEQFAGYRDVGLLLLLLRSLRLKAAKLVVEVQPAQRPRAKPLLGGLNRVVEIEPVNKEVHPHASPGTRENPEAVASGDPRAAAARG